MDKKARADEIPKSLIEADKPEDLIDVYFDDSFFEEAFKILPDEGVDHFLHFVIFDVVFAYISTWREFGIKEPGKSETRNIYRAYRQTEALLQTLNNGARQRNTPEKIRRALYKVGWSGKKYSTILPSNVFSRADADMSLDYFTEVLDLLAAALANAARIERAQKLEDIKEYSEQIYQEDLAIYNKPKGKSHRKARIEAAMYYIKFFWELDYKTPFTEGKYYPEARQNISAATDFVQLVFSRLDPTFTHANAATAIRNYNMQDKSVASFSG